MSSAVMRSALARGFYPERPAPDETPLERTMAGLTARIEHWRRAGLRRCGRIVPAVRRHEGRLAAMGSQELAREARELRLELRRDGIDLGRAARAFALVREQAGRSLQMRHFDVQLMGGWILLQGMVAEMQTGEGKTLTATLPAAAAAMAGIPVHLITVNDYLARRDAEWMEPVYRALGLTVGIIVQGMSPEDRRRAYRCDITYCTNKEVVFDYLRDRLDMGERPGPLRRRMQRLFPAEARPADLRLRGLHFGIVDEADSVLVDEARTPLIISGAGDSGYEARVYAEALGLSAELESGRDYRVDETRRQVELTREGESALGRSAERRGGVWAGRLRREELVVKALTARHLFHRDRHYVVRDDKVEIVDEYTGRIMPSRSWEGGLHQLIESKEGCPVTPTTEVLGRISYQRFFRRYLSLAGMTGTAREAARELWSVYRLKVVPVPTNRPSVRRSLGVRVFATAEAKRDAIVRRIREEHGRGRPVLVGTRTVADSRRLAESLQQAGLPCEVLNAVQDGEEARIVAQAGRRGQITVATNMAGRGTDIALEEGVAELGGLHVIASERHDAGRIDRQLFGRCGRQGEPGSFEMFVSLEDDLVRTYPTLLARLLGPGRLQPGTRLGSALGRAVVRGCQKLAESRHYQIRRELLKMDESLESALAFSGKGE